MPNTIPENRDVGQTCCNVIVKQTSSFAIISTYTTFCKYVAWAIKIMYDLCTKLRHCYLLIFGFWEIWMFAWAVRWHWVGFYAVKKLVRLVWVAVCLMQWFSSESLQFVLAWLFTCPHVTEIWVRIHFCRQCLLSASSRRKKFALFRVAPFHSSVLEPNFYLLGSNGETWEAETIIT